MAKATPPVRSEHEQAAADPASEGNDLLSRRAGDHDHVHVAFGELGGAPPPLAEGRLLLGGAGPRRVAELPRGGARAAVTPLGHMEQLQFRVQSAGEVGRKPKLKPWRRGQEVLRMLNPRLEAACPCT